jgi:hypothetical protein
MSYAVVSWEVSTGDTARAARITQRAEAALKGFKPARLLVNCFLLDTEDQAVEDIREALDSVAAAFPQEFFFTASDQVEADIQGVYPAFAEISDARVITGSQRVPRVRVPAPAIVAGAGGRAGARAGRRAGAARRKTRKKAARKKAARRKTAPRRKVGQRSRTRPR